MNNWVRVFGCCGQMWPELQSGGTWTSSDPEKVTSITVMLKTLHLTVGLRAMNTLLLSHDWWPAPGKHKACSCLPKSQPSDIPCCGFTFSWQEEPSSSLLYLLVWG